MLVRLDWVLPRTPTSVAIALTTPFRLVVVSCTSAPKSGSLACELDIEPIVARARIRSRIYDPVVDVPVETATEFALANNPVCTVPPSPVWTIGALIAEAGWDMYAENGDVPVTFEPAIDSVPEVVAAAPLADSPETAALICA